jgi:hypothetical protein
VRGSRHRVHLLAPWVIRPAVSVGAVAAVYVAERNRENFAATAPANSR